MWCDTDVGVTHNDTAMSVRERSKNYHEGWIEQKDKFGSWKRQWLVLKGNELRLCKTGNRGENPVWRLKLDDSTEVKINKFDEKKGYQFSLNTDKKKFKCSCENDRDLWVSFIDGLAHGDFERTHKLLPGQKTSIDAAIENWKMLQAHKSLSPSQIDEGIGSEFSDVSGESLNCGGPVKNHKFYNDIPGQPRKQAIPNWFFENCSRQLSEMVLDKGRDYGNVLMRESVTFKDNGSYVLSLRRDSAKGCEYEHFEVIQAAAGYQINVENIHCPCSCLQDVMDYFLQAAGSSYTCPLVTNDLATLGIHRPHYQSVIESVGPAGNTSTPTRSGPCNNKTWSAKRQSYQRGASSPDPRTTSQTVFGRSSENPFAAASSPLPPTSLRDVMRRGWSTEEKMSIQHAAQMSRPAVPLPVQTDPLPVPISPPFVPGPPPPVPVAPQQSSPVPNSLEAQIAAKAKLMNTSRRSSVPAQMSLNAQTPPPPPPVESPRPPAAPQSVHFASSPAAVPSGPPPPPPIPAAPAQPIAPPPPPAAPPAPPFAPPEPPAVTPAPVAPPAPPMATPSRHQVKTLVSPPAVPSVAKPAPQHPQVSSSPKTLQIGGQQVVFPTLKSTKTPPPPTKPKTRRSSESDVQIPSHLNLNQSSVESGIVEEEHPAVRDVRAMFDSGLSLPKQQSTSPPLSVHPSPPAQQPSQPIIRHVQVSQTSTAVVNTQPFASPPPPSAPAVPIAPPPPPPLAQTRPPTLAPPAIHTHGQVSPPMSVFQQEAPAEPQSREDFKRRLESLIGGTSVPVKSPTSTPSGSRLSTPMPPTPPQPNQENIYSEPQA